LNSYFRDFGLVRFINTKYSRSELIAKYRYIGPSGHAVSHEDEEMLCSHKPRQKIFKQVRNWSKISLIRATSACKHRSRESYRESSLLYTKGNDRNKTIDEHCIQFLNCYRQLLDWSIQLIHLFIPVAFFTPSTAPCAVDITCWPA